MKMLRPIRKIRKTKNAKGLSFYAEMVANISQIVLVLLAIFGYFYTVVPAYQNQTLNEENARLKIDNQKLTTEMELTKSIIQEEIEAKTSSLKELNSALLKKTAELQNANTKLIEAKLFAEKQIVATTNKLNDISNEMNLAILRNDVIQYSESRISTYFYSDEYRATMPKMFSILDQLNSANIDSTLHTIFDNSSKYVESTLGMLKVKYESSTDITSDDFIQLINQVTLKLEKIKANYNISESRTIQVELYLKEYLQKIADIQQNKGDAKGILDMVILKNNAVRDLMKMLQNYPDTSNIIEGIFSN